MKGLRTRFERFCLRNRAKGIPNLMLYIAIGSAIVYLMSMFDQSNTLYFALAFDKGLILQGQVWRLFTFVFTYDAGNLLLTGIGLLCYYFLGRAMEATWGTFRFNLFYFTGILLMDLFCLILGGRADVSYLNMSLFLAYATLYPDAQFLFLYFIPVKAWIFGLVDLALTIFDVVTLTMLGMFPFSLFPLVAIGNYLLFFGKDVLNLIPGARNKMYGSRSKPRASQSKRTGPIPFPNGATAESQKARAPYTHRCTVCGRTDISNPELEFRYCSKCKGYFCYCQDHISNHTHIE